MTKETVKMSIPFESLLESISKLKLQDKLRLWKSLNEQLAQIEEESYEANPTIQSEIREARIAYQAGDYVTLDEYISTQSKKEK